MCTLSMYNVGASLICTSGVVNPPHPGVIRTGQFLTSCRLGTVTFLTNDSITMYSLLPSFVYRVVIITATHTAHPYTLIILVITLNLVRAEKFGKNGVEPKIKSQ